MMRLSCGVCWLECPGITYLGMRPARQFSAKCQRPCTLNVWIEKSRIFERMQCANVPQMRPVTFLSGVRPNVSSELPLTDTYYEILPSMRLYFFPDTVG